MAIKFADATFIMVVTIGIGWNRAGNGKPEFIVPRLSDAAPAEVAFETMMDVITDARCLNCHPSDQIPKQGNDKAPHQFGITRAVVTNSSNALSCTTCHSESNNDYSGVPGAPGWTLAPESMSWEGLSRYEIARSMLDPKRNGNRTIADIQHHLTEDTLVLWAWEPGVDQEGNPRKLPPVSKKDFIQAVNTWVENGAVIHRKN